HLAPGFVHHAAEHLGEPKIDGGKNTEETAGEEHVMKMGDDKVGVMDEDIHRRGGHEDAAETADDEQGHEGEREQHRGGVLDVSVPKRAQPVEYLDGGG